MSNLKWFGKFCLVMMAALELGRILGNVTEGYSPFYLFNFTQRFSMDNNTFIIYWGAILGIFFVLADALNKFENKDNNTQSTQNINSESVKGFLNWFRLLSIPVKGKFEGQDRSREKTDIVLSQGLGLALNLAGLIASLIFAGLLVYGFYQEESYVMAVLAVFASFAIYGYWAKLLEILAKKRFLN